MVAEFKRAAPNGVVASQAVEKMLIYLAIAEAMLGLVTAAFMGFAGHYVQSWMYLIALALVLVLASISLARQRAHARKVSVLSLVHTLMAGIGACGAYYATLFARELRNPGGSSGDNGVAIDPNTAFARGVLWFSLVGAVCLALVCVVAYLRQPRQSQ